MIFAVVQDLKTREISNWLNFSLIAFVLGYRAFYSILMKDAMFFIYGLLGVVLFVILGYVFYYGKVFAGGDAKLLMGLGGVLPYRTFWDYLVLGGGFVLLLFAAGALWTIVFSVYLIQRNKVSFKKEFKNYFGRYKHLMVFSLVLGFVVGLTLSFIDLKVFGLIWFLVLVSLPLVYVYVKAMEKSCMIRFVSPSKLTEGDWLEKDVRIGKKTIEKSVHGLSFEDIRALKRAKKKVWIKEGVPFTPAFLIALIVGVWIWLSWLRYLSF